MPFALRHFLNFWAQTQEESAGWKIFTDLKKSIFLNTDSNCIWGRILGNTNLPQGLRQGPRGTVDTGLPFEEQSEDLVRKYALAQGKGPSQCLPYSVSSLLWAKGLSILLSLPLSPGSMCCWHPVPTLLQYLDLRVGNQIDFLVKDCL